MLGEVMAVSSPDYPLGTPVWVKMTGFPAWPALVWSLTRCCRCTWPDIITSFEKGE